MKQPEFLNVDLEIVSDSPELLKLAEELEKKAHILYADVGDNTGEYLMAMEVSKYGVDQETAIQNLCSLVEGFTKEQKAIWDRAKRRVFDVGYDEDTTGNVTRFTVGTDSLHRIAAVNGELAVSVYQRDEE
jgi:hypothetical protein